VPPIVSIIVPTHNNPELLRQTIDTIEAFSTIPYEVLIVDNNSTTAEAKAYLSTFPQKNARVVALPENRFYWPAINEGIRQASPGSRYFLALNDDIEVQGAQWLQRLIDPAGSTPGIGIVGDFHVRRAFKPLGGWVDGYCALISRKMVDEIGSFDESLKFYWGFVDFQLRAYKRGWRFHDIKQPGDVTDRLEGIVHHLRGQTVSTIMPTLSQVEQKDLFRSSNEPVRLLWKHGFVLEALSYFLKKKP
jgi:GT2 family glycosyltransferase